MSNNPPVEIRFTARFESEVRRLSRRYRRIRQDIQMLIDRLQTGELPGDQIPNIDYLVFKVRIRNSDAQKGKSGGYRVIYYLQTETQILLVTMYSKSDRTDITVSEVQAILSRAEAQLNSDV